MANEVKRDNFIHIGGFMVTELHLKGNELLIYACIYGFTQAENQKFTGSLQYLANWTNSTKQGVVKALNNLIDKGLIVKETKIINNVKFCEYYTTKFNTPIQQSCIPPIQQSLPNNIVLDNIEDNIEKNIKEIFDYWNSCKIIVHRQLNEKIIKAIKKALKEYKAEEIKEYINRYKTILNDKSFYFDYKWSLIDFLTQKNAMADFTDEGSKWNSYKNTNNCNKQPAYTGFNTY